MQKSRSFEILLLFFISSVVITESCSSNRLLREIRDPSGINHSDISGKNIKVHMKDGSLFFLDSLITGINSDSISGYGTYYNAYRDKIKFNIDKSGVVVDTSFSISLSDVALIETNRIEGLKNKVMIMALVGIPTVALSIYCIVNPKACFGSCPTFYAWDGKDTLLMAEGFSSSILRAFEKEDIDMLYWVRTAGDMFQLRMKNEALETHIVRKVDLLAAPRSRNDRVFATEGGEFYKSSEIQAPVTCIAMEGDCLDEVKQMDHSERFSLADSKNLASREIIEMNFENVPSGEHGLIIGCRQTLLTTYLFYQSLAYLGNSAGYFASRIESGDSSLAKKTDRIWNLLGGIEVFVMNGAGKWGKVSELTEMGPIATDVHLIKLPEMKAGNLHIRLRLTKGLWRIDYLALGKLDGRIEPVVIEPSAIIPANCTDNKLTSLSNGTEDPLVTLPGDVFDFFYKLPDQSTEYELFIKSRGYYLEWMRENWLAEKNPAKAALFFEFPALYMKMYAKKFKSVEPSMEYSFWNSKYVKE